jgi:hypothetical protein
MADPKEEKNETKLDETAHNVGIDSALSETDLEKTTGGGGGTGTGGTGRKPDKY